MRMPASNDKLGIKKGPWTPEEDIVLVSYIQQHGPGNWTSVPTNTGLLRCSKSCRLRWTNYLRPGIKRGNFTPNEEGMIIHLQALLGNKWAAIATYLPQRTDNDIKNFWNTRLKKKLKKLQSDDHNIAQVALYDSESDRIHERRIENKKHSGLRSVEKISLFDSSSENISMLLEEGWNVGSSFPFDHLDDDRNINNLHKFYSCDIEKIEFSDEYSTTKNSRLVLDDQEKVDFLENWAVDQSVNQVEGDIGIPSIF